ncbi:MAG: hypothetical protein Q7J30_02180 [Candidatus Azambacteria bacterium]|nr:hypothetical protein [Candidatus Azambacteria bacterium]
MVKLSSRNKLAVAVAFVLILLFFVAFGMYKWGAGSQDVKIKNLTSRLNKTEARADQLTAEQKRVRAVYEKLLGERDAEIKTTNAVLDECVKKVAIFEAAKKKPVAAKPAKKQVDKRQQLVKQPPPVTKQTAPSVVAQVAVPNFGATKLILRINVVEWAPVFKGKSLMSRDIGPIVRQGLANGTVVRAKEQLEFLVNGASVSVQDGQAIVDPGTIGPETTLVVQPVSGAKFASPPNGLPLKTNPGELDAVVKRGVSEIWINFILAPPPPATKTLPEKKEKHGRA